MDPIGLNFPSIEDFSDAAKDALKEDAKIYGELENAVREKLAEAAT